MQEIEKGAHCELEEPVVPVALGVAVERKAGPANEVIAIFAAESKAVACNAEVVCLSACAETSDNLDLLNCNRQRSN